MNKVLLRKVQKQILKDTTKFNMDSWANKNEVCGTTCCIGGWALALNGFKVKKVKYDGETNIGFCKGNVTLIDDSIETRAQRLLRLTPR